MQAIIEVNISRELLVAIYDCFNMRAQDYVRRYRSKMKPVTKYTVDEIDWCRIELLWNEPVDQTVPDHTLIQLCTFEDLYNIFLEYDAKNEKFYIHSFIAAMIGFVSGKIEYRDMYVSGPKSVSKKIVRLAMFPSGSSFVSSMFAIIIAPNHRLGYCCLGYCAPVEIVD